MAKKTEQTEEVAEVAEVEEVVEVSAEVEEEEVDTDDTEEEGEEEEEVEEVADADIVKPASPERLEQLSLLAKLALEHLRNEYEAFMVKVNAYEAAVTQRVSLTTWKEQLVADKAKAVAFNSEEVSIGDKSFRKLLAELSATNPAGLVHLMAFLDELRTLVNTELVVAHMHAFQLPEGIPTRDDLVEATAHFSGIFQSTKGWVGIHFDWEQLVAATGVPVARKGVRGTNGKAEQYSGKKYNAKKTTATGKKAFAIKGNSTKIRLAVDGKVIDDMTLGDAMKVYLDMTSALLNKWLVERGITSIGDLWGMDAVRFADDSKVVHAVSFVPTGTKEVPEAHTELLRTLTEEAAQAEADKANRQITSSGKREDETPETPEDEEGTDTVED